MILNLNFICSVKSESYVIVLSCLNCYVYYFFPELPRKKLLNHCCCPSIEGPEYVAKCQSPMFCEQNHHPSLQGLIHSTHKAPSPVFAAC